MADKRDLVRIACKSEAHLYVWGAVIDILEGSSTPGRSDAEAERAVERVIAIARKESQRLLSKHDAAVAGMSGKAVQS